MSNFFNLKIVAISHFISRSGTLYLHSLLDNHSEIATIPGTIDIVDLLNIDKNCTAEKCFNLFRKNNPKFFDTSKFTFLDKNNSSLWILGDNKKDKIITDENFFKQHFINCLENKEINSRNVIIALYYAYAKTHNKKIEKFKVILMHPHEKKTTLKFNKFFKDAIYLVPIRNPIRAYLGILKKIKYVNNLREIEYYPSGQLMESALDIKDFYDQKLDLYFIKIEDLGKNAKSIMNQISKILKINYENSMLESTFGAKKYWSNSVEKQTNHFDKSRHDNTINLPRKDLIILNLLNSELIEALKYQRFNLKFHERVLLPAIIFFPMEDEMEFLKNFKIRKLNLYAKFLIYFVPKRLKLIQVLLFNKSSNRYKYLTEKLIS